MKTQYTVPVGDEQRKVAIEPRDNGAYNVTVDGETVVVDAQEVGHREYHLLLGDEAHGFLVDGEAPEIWIHTDGTAIEVQLMDERLEARMAATGSGLNRSADGTVAISAPMPGKVVKCLVQEGQQVSEGQGVIVVEAMKMENELKSMVSGKVMAVKVEEGDNVDAGVCLVLIE